MERVRGFDRATQSISCCRVTLIVYPRRFKSLPPSARRNQLPSDKKQTRASLALEA